MKKLLPLLLLSLLACTANKRDNEVDIFNNISFKLIEGESLVEIKPSIKGEYLSYFKNTNLQIPLLKTIKSKDYTIYIGIPYNTSIQELIDFEILAQADTPMVLESSVDSFMFKKQNNDTIYVSEYSKAFNKNLIYVLAITTSKIISDSLFNQTKFSNRFNQNN